MRKYSTTFLILAVLTIVLTGNQLFKSSKLEAVEIKVLPTNATTQDAQLITIESTAGGAMSGQNSSDYFLPYPGILPGHPLYFLKDLRDKIVEMLIADPLRKSEFYLLQSDKWLTSGIALVEKNNTTAAKKILLDSSNRMTMAVNQLSMVKKNGGQVPAGNIDKIEKSIKKHEEVLTNITSLDTSEMVTILQHAEENVLSLK